MRPEIHRARVNIKSLAAEAVFIRQEMLVATSICKCDLHNHRVQKVRPESRLAFLAYAFLRGKTRSSCEISPKTEIDYEKLLNKIKRWGIIPPSKQEIQDWLKT
jgi:hypothetical protein